MGKSAQSARNRPSPDLHATQGSPQGARGQRVPATATVGGLRGLSAPFKTGRELRMQESHRKDLASHPDPESCVGGRETAGEALTGAHAGQPLSCEISYSGVPTPLSQAEGHTEGGATGKPSEDPAQSKTLRMRGNSLHGKREIPRVPTGHVPLGRSGKAINRTLGMYACGKSDDCVVPEKPPNKSESQPLAEAVEGRRSTKGNMVSKAASRTQRRTDVSIAPHRVRGVACRTTAITRGKSRVR